MELAVIADGEGTWLHFYRDIILSVLLQKTDIGHNAQSRLHLVRDVLHQLFRIGQTDHLALVVDPDIDCPALRIGKAAEPLQVLRPPRFLVFYVLVFSHKEIENIGKGTTFLVFHNLPFPIPLPVFNNHSLAHHFRKYAAERGPCRAKLFGSGGY